MQKFLYPQEPNAYFIHYFWNIIQDGLHTETE